MPWIVAKHTVKYGGRFYAAGQKFKVEDEHLHLIPDAIEVDGRNGKPKEGFAPSEKTPFRGKRSRSEDV